MICIRIWRLILHHSWSQIVRLLIGLHFSWTCFGQCEECVYGSACARAYVWKREREREKEWLSNQMWVLSRKVSYMYD